MISAWIARLSSPAKEKTKDHYIFYEKL